MTRFRVRPKRTPTDTRLFLLRMAGQGQGGPPERRAIRTEDQLKEYFAAHDCDYTKEFAEARKKDAVIPLLTVHLDSDMFASMGVRLPEGGQSFMAYGNDTDGWVTVRGGSGRIVGNQYLDSFNYAVKNLNRCTGDEEPDYRDLLSAFTSGMASIEAFVNKRVRRHLDPSRMDVEQALSKTHLETKIFEWLPSIYGLKVDRGKPPWQDYEKLRRHRNESYIHPKSETDAVSDKEFCQRLNLFRTGIARLLLDLHCFGDYGAPPELIKYAYWPEIEVVED